jgi:hypothetical protein
LENISREKNCHRNKTQNGRKVEERDGMEECGYVLSMMKLLFRENLSSKNLFYLG